MKKLRQHIRKRKTKVIYDNVRKIRGKQALRVRAVRDKDGVVLVNREQIKNTWGEHFHCLNAADHRR